MLSAPHLKKAIEDLYRVFSKYPLQAEVHACPCCHDKEDEKKIHSKPLHRLTAEDLEKFAMDALYTWGTPDDFRHFLPRLFELLTIAERFEVGYANAEIVFNKLTYAEWRSWAPDEQKAIQRFFHALWESALDTKPQDFYTAGIETVICAIAQAENDLAFYLDEWLSANTLNACHNLVLMITRSGILSRKRYSSNAFWEQRKDQCDQLSKWLHAGRVKKKLLHALEIWPEEKFAGEMEQAVALLP